MAKKVEISYIDDLDGSAASETVQFMIDGADYEIDLSSDNAALLRLTLEDFVKAARRHRSTPRTKSPAPNEHTAKIRAWASANGHPVNKRGRLHKDIVEAYENANREH